MSSNIEIRTTQWKQVELGRVVLFINGPYSGRLAAIVEIVDHKRVLVDGPSKKSPIHRHSAPLAHVILTPIVIPNLPRGIRTGPLSKKWQKHEVEEKWAQSSWAKSRVEREKRRNMGDFDRFKNMKLRKQTRAVVRQEHAKLRKAA